MIKIAQEKLLIVEGTHEIKFFRRLITIMGLNNIQIEQIGGNDFDRGC
jgi:hypothetical protein